MNTNNVHEKLKFISCEYYSTGEGSTVSLLITVPKPNLSDYVSTPKYIRGTGEYMPGILPESGLDGVALREFKDIFGEFYAHRSRIHNHEYFFEKYKHLIPEYIADHLNKDNIGYFKWFTQHQLNNG